MQKNDNHDVLLANSLVIYRGILRFESMGINRVKSFGSNDYLSNDLLLTLFFSDQRIWKNVCIP
jgi:hypothetical protein